MKYKEGVSAVVFEALNPRVQALLLFLDWYSVLHFGVEVVITSMYREDGIHGCFRAADVRIREYTEEQRLLIVRVMNRFKYDETRPEFLTCLYGDEAHMDHFHIQVKP